MSLLESLEGAGNARIWIRAHLDYPHRDWCLLWPFSRSEGGRASFSSQRVLVHRLMCEYRNGPPPTPKHQAAHSCARGQDACVNPWHVSWKTNSENQLDRYELSGPGRRAKLTPEQVGEIIAMTGLVSISDLAQKYGVIETNIRRIQQGKLWKNTSTLQCRVFTEAEVRLIRSIPWQEKSARQWAEEFGVKRTVIDRIRGGITYKWVSFESAEPTAQLPRSGRGTP